jgi:hypothetical protein
MINDIYQYITEEELAFQNPIDILGWEWSMADHIKTSFYYKHGRLLNGNDEYTPVKNIIKPILNMEYWAEDIDVKDVLLYLDDPEYYHLSFLVKKYHDDVFVLENNLDEYFDELNQSRIDYGGGISMDTGQARPKVVELESVAFCNQSNLLKSPIGFKLYYSPGELKEMEEKGWGKIENGATITIDELIELAKNQSGAESTSNIKNPVKDENKYIQIYLVLGMMSKTYLDDGESEELVYQQQIVGFYQKPQEERKGVVLFRKKVKPCLKLIKRDPVFGRALGFGGAEELFEPQVWTNKSEIRVKD